MSGSYNPLQVFAPDSENPLQPQMQPYTTPAYSPFPVTVGHGQAAHDAVMRGLVGLSPSPADAYKATAGVVSNAVKGAATAAADPQTWLDAAHQWGQAMLAGTGTPGVKLPIRPASEDIYGVLQASFPYGRVVGPKTVPIDSLSGGVALNDPQQAARIAFLKAQMTGPDGYISRPIVDTNGNVIEGQHRLEALRQLGVQKVPVHVIQDLADGVNIEGLHAAIKAAQPMHSDNLQQLTQELLETVAHEGSPDAVREGYDPPRGYGAAWNAALDFLSKK